MSFPSQVDKEIMELKRRIIELEKRLRELEEEKAKEPWLTKQKRKAYDPVEEARFRRADIESRTIKPG